MSVLNSYFKLNDNRISAIYNYEDFSYIFDDNQIRTINKVLSTIINLMYKHSDERLTNEKILDMTYKDKSWIAKKSDFEFIFKKLYDEEFFIEATESQEKKIKIFDNSQEIWPIHISFEVTQKCNFKCPFCYNEFSNKQEDMNISEIEKLITKLREKGLKSIELTGGELFSRGDVFKIIDAVYEKVDNLFILTNGYFINKTVVEKLVKYKKKLLVVGISLHSSEKEKFENTTGIKGSFNKVINAIKLLKENNFTIRIACPIINQDKNEIDRLCEFLKKLGISSVQFGINMNPEFILSNHFLSNRLELDNLIKKMDQKYPELNLSAYKLANDINSVINIIGCGAFSKNFVLTPTGMIKCCAYIPEKSIFTLNKIEESSLTSKKMKIIQKFITGNYIVNEKTINQICEECENYTICGHCFYVKSILNKEKNKCLLNDKFDFQYEAVLKDIT